MLPPFPVALQVWGVAERRSLYKDVLGYVESRSDTHRLRALAASLMLLSRAPCGLAQTETSELSAQAAAQCTAFKAVDFSEDPDALIQIMRAQTVEAAVDIPSYCQIEGYVSPQVGFEVRLPINRWNGKLLALGNGGSGGVIDGSGCDTSLKRGYACIVSDFGHKGLGAGPWALNNLQAHIDLGYRAGHVVALAGKTITAHFYTRTPSQSYFMGCSGGGREAMMEAQRFPWDFDGIIAGAPDLDAADWAMRGSWAGEALRDKNGHLVVGADDLQLLHRAALRACDKDDGVEDGIVGNPLGCKFDPETIVCPAREKKNGCLQSAQIDVIKRIYTGPTTSAGVHVSLPIALPGSELHWSDFTGLATYTNGLLRYGTYGLSIEHREVDLDVDYRRIGLGSPYAANNPDLRRYKAAGRKLIAYVGANDTAGVVMDVVDYYHVAEKVMGGRQSTQDFFRLFFVPGMSHCGGGEGAWVVDYLSYLEAWVERHQPPDKLIGSHVRVEDVWDEALRGDRTAVNRLRRRVEFPLDPKTVEFSRPLYPYPSWSKYSGAGDPKNADNFRPVEP